MSRKCSVSNKRRKVGNSVSHSNVKVKRAQEVNLRTKKFWLEEENRWIKLKVCTKVIKTIAKNGLAKTLRKNGVYKKLVG